MNKTNKTPRKNAKATSVLASDHASAATVEVNRDTGMVQGFAVAYGSASLSRTQAGFINSVTGLAADDLLVGMLANQVETKMAANREAGKYGWHTEACSSDQLRIDLKKLVAKGDYIDAAIVSAMLLLREQLGLS